MQNLVTISENLAMLLLADNEQQQATISGINDGGRTKEGGRKGKNGRKMFLPNLGGRYF